MVSETAKAEVLLLWNEALGHKPQAPGAPVLCGPRPPNPVTLKPKQQLINPKFQTLSPNPKALNPELSVLQQLIPQWAADISGESLWTALQHLRLGFRI